MLKKTEKVATISASDGRAIPRHEDSELIDIATPSALPDAINPGDTLGNYLVLSKLGEGGMGMVYKAHDPTLDRMVALKIISPHLFRNQEYLDRFRVEAQAQARLNSPNIVTLHSMFQLPSWLVLVMEYVEGETLAQRLHKQGRLNFSSSIWVFEQVLLGVDRAHRMGVVHRDLKPGNIFITTGNEVKLMDFGVARMVDNKGLTMAGSMVGTLTYISPEQINGKEADFRSDIYTLGITLYEAVTGRPPFEYRTDFELMSAHLTEQPPRPSILQPDVPEELETVILRAIEKDPDKRHQTAREFRNALLRVGMTRIKAYERLKKPPKSPAYSSEPVESVRAKNDDGMLENYLESEPVPPPAVARRNAFVPPSSEAYTVTDIGHMPFSMYPQKVRATGQYTPNRALNLHDRRVARRRFLAALGLYAILPPVAIVALMLIFGGYPKTGGDNPVIDLSSLSALWRDIGGRSASEPATATTTGGEAAAVPSVPPPANNASPNAGAGNDKDKQYDTLRKAWR